MNDNRNRYTSTPMSGSRRKPEKEPRAYMADGTAQSPHTLLQIILVFFLPILCLFALFGRADALRWIFLILSIGALFFMWLCMAFVPSARKMVTVIYAVLIVLVAVSLGMNRPIPDVSVDYSGQQTSANPVNAPSNPQDVVNEPTSRDIPVSEAQTRFETLMNYWSNKQYDDMLEMCLPSWINSQSIPSSALFEVIALREPSNWEIINIGGNDSSDNRTITIHVSIKKENSIEMTRRYKLDVVMQRVNSVWYVDPLSLKDAGDPIPEETAAQQGVSVTFTPKPAATPTPGPTYLLYYNSKGGEYYHAEAECKRVDARYFPLSTFYYKDLNTAPYKNLKPCPYCDAPNRE